MRVSATRLTLLSALLLGLAGATSAAAEPPRVGSAGVTVERPSGWHTTELADGNVVDPLTRVVVSSAPIRRRAVPCQIARYAPSASAVSLVLVEWERATTSGTPRPRRFTSRNLRLHPPPAIECFDGPGGSVHFNEQGRTFGAYLLLGRDAPPALADRARSVLDTLVVRARAAASVALVPLSDETLAHCRASALLRPACPRLVPRVRAPYLSHLNTGLLGRGAKEQLVVFNLERGGEYPERPERNRPPRMSHLVIVAGAVEKIAANVFDGPRPARLRNGLMRLERTGSLALGRVRWAGRTGSLLLAPPYLHGGVLGNHLVFRWRLRGVDYLLTLHAWEPLLEAVATLRAIVRSTPRRSA